MSVIDHKIYTQYFGAPCSFAYFITCDDMGDG